MMEEIWGLGITMSEPLAFGSCELGGYVYSLVSWIEGTAAEEAVPNLSVDEQYNLGSSAGRILKRFHSVKAPPGQEDWAVRMHKKIAAHLEKYKECGIKVKGDIYAFRYIEDNLYLLKDRPQVFQHGDFHLGNLILTPSAELGVIDFNRWDYGDPFEDFYKMSLFSREVSIPFARGQIHGYFDTHELPEDFFTLLALYIADVILYSIVWAIPFGKEEVQGMMERAYMILKDYNNFETVIPKWFLNPCL